MKGKKPKPPENRISLINEQKTQTKETSNLNSERTQGTDWLSILKGKYGTAKGRTKNLKSSQSIEQKFNSRNPDSFGNKFTASLAIQKLLKKKND